MSFTARQQEIDGILKTLDEIRRYSGLGPNDPAVIELERIMMAKVAELEAAKADAAQNLESEQHNLAPVCQGIQADSEPLSPAHDH